MKKRNIFLVAGFVSSVLLFQSCTKKIDEAYINPNANVVQPIELLLPNIIQNMAISNTANGTLYGPQNDGQYVGRYVQFWATNTTGNQYDQMGGATGGSDILGSIWAMHYYGMGQNLNRVIEWGTEQKKWDYVGVAHAIRAWSWLTLTDMHGEAILKDAFNTNILVFRYDTQQEIFEQVKTNVRLAIENLNKTGDGVDQANLAKGAQFSSYKGDVSKWKRFAYGVMARVFNRYTNKGTLYQPDSVIHYANLAMNTNADNLNVLFEGGATIRMSYYGPSRGNIGAFRQTKFAADLFSGINTSFLGASDPRAWYKLRENANGTFKGVTPTRGTSGLTTNEIPLNFWGNTAAVATNPTPRYIWQDIMPWPVMTASEIQFLKAEAYYRKGSKNEALNAYREGIRLDFDMLTEVAEYGNNVPTARKITPAVRDAYLANTTVVPTLANFNLSHIMLQKFMALYGYGMIETWVDMRRFHYNKDFEDNTTRVVYTDLTPPATNELFADNRGNLVYRARPRYNSEYLYNVDALNQIGAMNGNSIVLDYHTKETWFSIR